MSKQKKILIIGAGIGQVHLCELAKKRGLYVIVVTIPGDYPCVHLADKVYYIDIYDRENIVKVAQEEQIDAVISDQNDLMMPTVAYVAEQLHLPGNTLIQTKSYCNKNVYRDNCDKIGIPVPKHFAISATNTLEFLEDVTYPLIVKPEDSQSSMGISVVHNKAEYTQAIELALRNSKNSTAIVEEFFEGTEVVVEGFIYKGQYYNLGFADRKYFELKDKFIPSQTIFPSVVSEEIQQTLLKFEQQYAQLVSPAFGIVHSEYLINKSGEIRAVESAIRGGGVYISSHLIPLFTGINISEILLDCALGAFEEKRLSVFEQIAERAAAYVCFYLHEGMVSAVSGLTEIKQLDFVHKCDVNVRVGDSTKAMTFKGNRYGPIIVSGNGRMDVEKNIATIQSTLQIEVLDNNSNKCNIVWN